MNSKKFLTRKRFHIFIEEKWIYCLVLKVNVKQTKDNERGFVLI